MYLKASSILSSTSPFHMAAVLQASIIKGATVQGEARKGGRRGLKAQPRCEGFVEQPSDSKKEGRKKPHSKT